MAGKMLYVLKSKLPKPEPLPPGQYWAVIGKVTKLPDGNFRVELEGVREVGEDE